MITLTVDATPGAVKDIATELLGSPVGVTDGRWVEVTLADADAKKLRIELEECGYKVW